MGSPPERKTLAAFSKGLDSSVCGQPGSRQGLRGTPVCYRSTLAVGPEMNLGLGHGASQWD